MVIINADDLGMNEACSRAIAQAFSMGLVTDTTMMATGEYFDGAVRLAKEQGFFNRIGIHFNLTEGIPLTTDICRAEKFVKSGRFHKGYDGSIPLTATEEKAVYKELSAQVMKLKNAGIVMTHADSHHYVHNMPYLAPIVVRVCKMHGIGKVRLQRNFGEAENPKVNAYYREQGLRTTDYFCRLRDIENGMVPDNAEILVHPDYDRNDRLIDRMGMQDGYPTGEKLVGLKRQSDIELGSYGEL